MQCIDSERDIANGIAALTALPNHGAQFARAFEATGLPPLRRRPEGFAELLRAIVGQQVSVASASAIWARLEAAGMVAPDPILAASDDALRALGLSRSKARYARALAEAGIDFDALRHAPDAEILETLTRVTGIGRWTAEIYALMSLGRADIFPAGDLALQEAARVLFDLPARPREAALRNMAEAWRPQRAVAARLLWAYYRVITSREGVL